MAGTAVAQPLMHYGLVLSCHPTHTHVRYMLHVHGWCQRGRASQLVTRAGPRSLLCTSIAPDLSVHLCCVIA